MKTKTLLMINILINITVLVLVINFGYEPEDVNKDGKVDALDLLIVQKYILNNME